MPLCVYREIVVRHRAPRARRRLRTDPYGAVLANNEARDAASRRDAVLRMNSPLRNRRCRAAFEVQGWLAKRIENSRQRTPNRD
jgi:hypothetical protein